MNNWMKLWFMEILRKNDSNLIFNHKSVSIQILVEFSSKNEFTVVCCLHTVRVPNRRGGGGVWRLQCVYSYLLMFPKFRTSLFSHLRKGHFWKFCQKIITPGPTPFYLFHVLKCSFIKVCFHAKSLFLSNFR